MSALAIAPAEIFAALVDLRAEAAAWQRRMIESAPDPALGAGALALDQALAALVAADADAVLGALLLDDGAPYAEVHPLMVGALCELVARRLALAPSVRLRLLAAVFSSNLALVPLQAALARAGTLDATLDAAVREHPAESHALLRRHGVEDPLWLAIVRQHHERPDGSGYPAGLRGAALEPLARLVSLADIYAAMVLPREYRTGIRAQQAVRHLFLARGQEVDAALAADFIGEIGVFPPGAFVRLVNGETGVVVRRGSPRRECPVVSSFRSPRGGVYPRPLRRDGAGNPRFGVADVLGRERLPHSPATLWAAAG
ncbi:MAG TPA: HD domain-containing phosphohydrolase [Gammaproteobacteria bacterium]|nr:HD domain-containing phosphohydrolase [Gammaproteobacteria bacterium]